MISSTWDRSLRVSAASNTLAVAAVCVGVLVLALSASVPEAWRPRTGQAFVADAGNEPAGRQDPCRWIVGESKAYCERGTALRSATGEQHDADGAVRRLVPIGAGLAALVIWRCRRAAGQGRG
jgi:hypothetical protein